MANEEVTLQSSEGVEFNYNGPAWAKEDTLQKLLAISTSQARAAASSNKSVTELLKKEMKILEKEQKTIDDNLKFQKEINTAIAARNKEAKEAERQANNFYDRLVAVNNDMADAVAGLDFDTSMARMSGILGEEVRGGIGTTIKKGFMGPFNFALETTGTALGVLEDTAKVVGSAFMSVAGIALTAFTTALGFTVGRLFTYADSFRQLNEVGMNFASQSEAGANSMVELARQASNANLSIDQFTKALTDNTAVAIAIGTESFAQISKNVRMAAMQFGQYGMTIDQLNEFTGDYLEMQRVTGTLQAMSEAERTKRSNQYLQSLTNLTRVTGLSRRQIADSLKQQKDEATLKSYLLTLDADARKSLTEVTDSVQTVFAAIPGGDQVGEAFGQIVSGLPAAGTEFGQTLARAGAHSEMAALEDLGRQVRAGKISKEEAQQRSMDLLRSLQGNESFRKQLATMTLAGDENAKAMTGFIGNLQGADLAAVRNQLAQDGTTKSFNNMGEIFNKFGTMFDKIISGILSDPTIGKAINDMFSAIADAGDGLANTLGDKVIPRFIAGITDLVKGDTLGKLATGFGNMVDKVFAFISNLADFDISTALFGGTVKTVDEDGAEIEQKVTGLFDGVDLGAKFSEMIGKAFSGVVSGFMSLLTNPLVIAGLVGVFAGPKIIGAIASGAGSLMSNMAGGILNKIPGLGGGGGAPKVGTKMAGGGKAMAGAGKGLGGFIGGLGEGVMKGAAAGLSAFGAGNVKILLGAATVAGVITAIGAGIAAAAWLTGKALPSFIEGIKGFEELDGTKLIDAAKGMAAISGAMAAFGAGTAVAGLGSLVGGITSGLAGLFGGETDPLAQMKKFSDADIDGAKVKANAEALVAFNTAMAGAGVANASAGAGMLISSIAGFFGGDTPIDTMLADMSKFSNVAIDGAKIKANADALVAFNTALAGTGAGVDYGSGGSLLSSIAGFFGGDTPFDQMMNDIKTFGAAEINAANVEENATAMAAFSNALSGLSVSGISDIEIPKNLDERLTDLAAVPSLSNIAEGMTAIATVSGLESNVKLLNSLDTNNLTSFADAMEDLVTTLGKLNEELAEDNKGLFGGTGVAAKDVVSQMGGNSQLSIKKLERIVAELQEIKKIHKDNAAVS